MEIVYYDRGGNPIAYSDNQIHIFLFDGSPVGYFYQNSVFSFTGEHLGWLSDGWIFDHNGNRILFSLEARGGPVKPVAKLAPIKYLKKLLPLASRKRREPVKSIETLNWSELTPAAFLILNEEE
jgi:hypothetical protein